MKYRKNSVEKKMLMTCFSKTKELVDAKEEPGLLGEATDVVLWQDPALKEATSKLMIYDTIKTKARSH